MKNNLGTKIYKSILLLLILCTGIMLPQKAFAGVITTYSTPEGIRYYLEEDVAVIYGYYDNVNTSGNIVIPAKITHDGVEYPVTKIMDYAFSGKTGVQSVTIAPSVKEIGQGAFGDTSLTSVTFEKGSCLETIGASAFAFTKITEIEIPAKVKILNRLFLNCNELKSITFENGSQLETITDRAFAYIPVTQVSIPSGVREIGNYAFRDTEITSIEIPASVTTLGEGVFGDCKQLQSVTIAKDSLLETIPEQAFYNSGITSIQIPAFVKSIGKGAFQSCTSLANVTFAEGCQVEVIEEYTFYSNSALSSVEIPASVKSIGVNAFTNCYDLKTVVFPEDSVLETIGVSAFHGACVEEIHFPASLKTIEKMAFYGADLQEVVIPAGVTTWGESSFAGMENDLKVVYYPETLSSQAETAFKVGNTISTSYYDKGLMGVYTVSDTTPPCVTVYYLNQTEKVEFPENIPGVDNPKFEVGEFPEFEESIRVGCGSKTLTELSNCLPEGCFFEKPDTELVAGTTKIHKIVHKITCRKFEISVEVDAHIEDKTVLYTGKDEKLPTCTELGMGHTECEVCGCTYETSIEVEATGHPSTEVRDVLEATCQKEGYSGDTWCKTCESIVEKGSSIAKKDHGWHGEAINKENETKYPFIEIKGVKESTCKEEGYSGDIWCKECKIELKKGTVIAKKEHTWDEGVVTEEATRLEKGTKSYTCTTCQENKTEEIPEIGAHKKGSKIRDKQNKGIYKVTKAALSGGTVEYVKPVNKKKSTVSIPSTIKVDGVTYKVTSIANNAFKNNKKIKKLTIGKNVSRIGTKAFYGCKKLKTIAIKTTKLKTKNIGSKAFNGIASKATIKVPKKKYTAYKKLLKKKGVGSKAVLKKTK